MPLQIIIANLKRKMAGFHWWEVLYWAHKTSLLSQQSQLNITIIVWCKFCTVMMHWICKKVTCMVLITQTVCKYLFLLSFWMEWFTYWAPDIIHWENSHSAIHSAGVQFYTRWRCLFIIIIAYTLLTCGKEIDNQIYTRLYVIICSYHLLLLFLANIWHSAYRFDL